MARLPVPGKDDGIWGDILNEYLSQTHNEDGSLKEGIITAAAIVDGTITETKLGTSVQNKLNAVGSGSIADGAVTTAKLHDDAVTNIKVDTNAAIAQSKIANLTTDLAAKAPVSHTHTISQVSDSTTIGRQLVTAANATDVRTAIGALSQTEIENIVGNYEPEATALFDRMSIRPDANRRSAINTLIASLKSYDLWNRLDGLYMFAAHTQQAALLNWRRTTANMTAVNVPIFTTDVGFTGDGVSAGLSNVSAATINTQSTDVELSLWIKTKATSGSSWDISWSGWEGRLVTGNNNVGWRVSETTGDNTSISNAVIPGLYTIARAGANESRMYKDGSLADSNTNAYNAAGTYTSTNPIRLLSDNGTTRFINATYSFCSYGASMNDAEAALFYNSVNTYMTAVGVV